VRFSEKIVHGSHLFEYDGAGAWNIALLMSDTCSAQDDSKGSSPRILSSLLFFLPRPAQKLPHMFRARKTGTRGQTSQDALWQCDLPTLARKDGRDAIDAPRGRSMRV